MAVYKICFMQRIEPNQPGLRRILVNPQATPLFQTPRLDASQIEQWVKQARQDGEDPDYLAAVANQWQLQTEATTKLGSWATTMLLTRPGLEQATRQVVAQFRAGIFRTGLQRLYGAVTDDCTAVTDDCTAITDGCVALPQIYDFGCGLGADAAALLEQGLSVLGIEIDPDTAALAQYNFAQFSDPETESSQLLEDGEKSEVTDPSPQPGNHEAVAPRKGTGQVRLGDVHRVLEELEGVLDRKPIAFWADPARRMGNRRLLRPEQWSPSLSRLVAVASDPRDCFGIKIAPGIDYADIPVNTAASWISVQGDLVEACLWSRNLNPQAGARWAAVITGDGKIHIFDQPEISDPTQKADLVPPALQLGRYLWEPDPAVIRAGGIGKLYRQEGAAPIGTGLAYLTCDHLPSAQNQPFVKVYRIIDDLPLKPKVVKKYLAEQGVTRIDVKKRGVKIDPANWHQQVLPGKVRSDTKKTLVLALTRVSQKHRCLVLEPA